MRRGRGDSERAGARERVCVWPGLGCKNGSAFGSPRTLASCRNLACAVGLEDPCGLRLQHAGIWARCAFTNGPVKWAAVGLAEEPGMANRH